MLVESYGFTKGSRKTSFSYWVEALRIAVKKIMTALCCWRDFLTRRLGAPRGISGALGWAGPVRWFGFVEFHAGNFAVAGNADPDYQGVDVLHGLAAGETINSL